MHLFTNYIQPLTLWLHAHPQVALLITFIISFGESLAIIGSIVPGSITMTAIGILAGSGVMRIDLTFLAATLGAIAGDSGSYLLGYILRDRLTHMWPFNRYPHWLKYGKDYFEHHGTTSIFLGRFFGPMRSIVPLIAGMMRMNNWHFLIANIASAIGWSALYVAPGVIIGIASSELPPESTTRFFAIILTLLIVIWISSLGAKWLLIRFNKLFQRKLHALWVWLKTQPYMANYARSLAPHPETNHFPTAALTLLFILCFFISITTLFFVLSGDEVYHINLPIHVFLQSLRTTYFDAFFIENILLITPIPLLTLSLSFMIYLFIYRDWRALRYWLCLSFVSLSIILLGMQWMDMPRPNHLLHYASPPSFLDINVTIATAWIGFLFFYLGTVYQTVPLLMFRILLIGILIFASFGSLYLGAAWFTSIIASYSLGLAICLFHWLLYRRKTVHYSRSQLGILLISLVFLSASTFSNFLDYKKLVSNYSASSKTYFLSHHDWWSQQQRLPLLYTTNRFGKPNSFLNIQYAGSLKIITSALEKSGWKKRSNSFFYSLIIRAAGKKTIENMPLMIQLYQNKKPEIVMTYYLQHENNLMVLQLWHSNYHFSHNEQPILIGSLVSQPFNKKLKKPALQPIANLTRIKRALPKFQFKQTVFSKHKPSDLANSSTPVLLLINTPPAVKKTSN
jgi:membrane protein DedA with SNARE-associated domain